MLENNIFMKSRAHFRFEKARNRAFFNDLASKFFRKNNYLFQFDEVKYLLSPYGMSYRGIQSIQLDQIVGSEGRYRDFDINFMPLKNHNRERWENVDIAKQKDISLPPILVYKIGDFYFVRDGNHRVSVARELKQDYIDAEVVELFTKVKLEEIGEKELLLAESYRYFLEKTQFDALFPNVEIKLTNPWGYYRLVEHINTYKYLLSEKQHKDVTWKESVKKWYMELYLPLVKLIKKRRVLKKFPGREVGDLYIWIMDHWHFLKEKSGNVGIEEALDDYSSRFGKGPIGLFLSRLLNLFAGKNKKAV
jgi:hypothetical protein